MKKHGIIAIVAGFALILTSVLFITFAVDPEEAEFRQIAEDLGALCENLSAEEIMELGRITGDIMYVARNVLLFDTICMACDQNGLPRGDVLELVKNLDLFGVLEVLEQAGERGVSAEEAMDMLNAFAGGANIYEVMAGAPAPEERTFRNYSELSKEQIRALLASGRTGEDIAFADRMAREIDISIYEALAMKDRLGLSWEELAEMAGSPDEEPAEEDFSLVVEIGGAKEIYSADDAEGLQQKVLEDYEQKEEMLLDSLESKGIDTSKYTDMGYIPEEIETAKRLSDESGMSMDEIIGLRESGNDWPEIIAEVEEAS